MFAKDPQIDRNEQLAPRCEDSLYAVATAYLHHNWSLIPLLGKQPGVATWKEYQTRLPSADEVRAWFAAANPRPTGIGIITGKLSGLIVVDCDSSEDANHWLGRFPRSPLMVETGRGGLHVYYEAPSNTDVHNRVKLFHRAIDVRGEGGYVAAPPSRHPSGKLYAWTAACVDFHQTLPQFDAAWLIDSEGTLFRCAPDVHTTVFRNVAAYIGRIHAIAGHGGHSSTFRAACKLRDAGLSPEDALALLVEWNKTNAHPPWSASELHHKIQSAYQVRGLAGFRE